MAVLSVLLTAPIGAIGIMIMAERILDYGERSTYRFKELRGKMGLSRVGERILNKRLGTVWKVIGERRFGLKMDYGRPRMILSAS